MTPDRKPHLLARRGTIRILRVASSVMLVLVLLAEAIVDRHPDFDVDRQFGFYAWYGFGACVAMVLFSNLVGRFLKRRDDYYGE